MGKHESHLLCESVEFSHSCSSDKCRFKFEMNEKYWWNVTNRRSGNTRRITSLWATWFTLNPTRNEARSKLVLSCGKKSINGPSQWTASKDKNCPGLIWRRTLCVAANILHLQFKNKEKNWCLLWEAKERSILKMWCRLLKLQTAGVYRHHWFESLRICN